MQKMITTGAVLCVGIVLLATLALFPVYPIAAISFKVGLIVGLLLYAGVVHAGELRDQNT